MRKAGQNNFARGFEALVAEGVFSAVGGWVVEELSWSLDAEGRDAFELYLVWETKEARTRGKRW